MLPALKPDAQDTAERNKNVVPPCPAPEPDSVSPSNADRLTHALMGRLTSSVSPVSLMLAYMDWALHLSVAPGKWGQLIGDGVRKTSRLCLYAAQAATGAPVE